MASYYAQSVAVTWDVFSRLWHGFSPISILVFAIRENGFTIPGLSSVIRESVSGSPAHDMRILPRAEWPVRQQIRPVLMMMDDQEPAELCSEHEYFPFQSSDDAFLFTRLFQIWIGGR